MLMKYNPAMFMSMSASLAELGNMRNKGNIILIERVVIADDVWRVCEVWDTKKVGNCIVSE